MVQISLEARLRRRLLLLVTPVVVGVGVASVLVTRHALEASSREVARARAQDLLRDLRDEIDEGTPIDAAARETLAVADAHGDRALVRGLPLGGDRASRFPVPSALGGIAVDTCKAARDQGGRAWQACAVADGSLQAIVAVPVDAHAAVVGGLARWMLVVVGAALLALVAAARWTVRRPLQSLRRIAEWSERVVAEDAPPRAPKVDTAEIQRLTAAFDALVQRLFEALERERSTSAHLAHELRTPLTALRVELEALAPRCGEDAARLLTDLDRIARVIDAILVLSTPPTATGAASVVNLADVVRELAPQGAVVVAPDEALVQADLHLVELALVNLLENADKYAGGTRLVQLSEMDGFIRLAVVDAGPGLPESARERMFARYWRGQSDGPGRGLGLALVRAVAERCGGYAEAIPNPAGRGLEVAIAFGRVLGWHQESPR